MNDSVTFGKFLEEMRKFRGSLEIGFFQFTLSESRAEELLKFIGTTSVLKKVTFLNDMTVSDQIKEKLEEESRKRNWYNWLVGTGMELVFE